MTQTNTKRIYATQEKEGGPMMVDLIDFSRVSQSQADRRRFSHFWEARRQLWETNSNS